MKPAVTIATTILALVCIMHMLRLVFQVQVTVGGDEIPLWMSVPGALGSGGLSVWLWREQPR